MHPAPIPDVHKWIVLVERVRESLLEIMGDETELGICFKCPHVVEESRKKVRLFRFEVWVCDDCFQTFCNDLTFTL